MHRIGRSALGGRHAFHRGHGTHLHLGRTAGGDVACQADPGTLPRVAQKGIELTAEPLGPARTRGDLAEHDPVAVAVHVDPGEGRPDGDREPLGGREDLCQPGRHWQVRVDGVPGVQVAGIPAVPVDDAEPGGCVAVLVHPPEQGDRCLAVERVHLDVDRRPGSGSVLVDELLGAERAPDATVRDRGEQAGGQLVAGLDLAVVRDDLPPAVTAPERQHAAGVVPAHALDDHEVGQLVPRDVPGVGPAAELLGDVDAVRPGHVVDVELAAPDHAAAGPAELVQAPFGVHHRAIRRFGARRAGDLLSEVMDLLVAPGDRGKTTEHRSQEAGPHRDDSVRDRRNTRLRLVVVPSSRTSAPGEHSAPSRAFLG